MDRLLWNNPNKRPERIIGVAPPFILYISLKINPLKSNSSTIGPNKITDKNINIYASLFKLSEILEKFCKLFLQW